MFEHDAILLSVLGRSSARPSWARMGIAGLLLLAASCLVAFEGSHAAARPAGDDAVSAAPADQVAVLAEHREVVGRRSAEGVRYLGIPYAKPPIDNLRFRPPEPVALPPRFVANRLSPSCPQHSRDVTGPTSEDCLTLHVFTPGAEAASKRPVIVWIYGGGFAEGSSSLPLYDGLRLAARAGAVIVTFNYRIGALGFLGHPALDRESSTKTSGNYGLLDQQAVLRWVRLNIASFGGNRDKVTIIGQSAGGFSVLAHLASPASAGLFQRAIMISSPPSAAGRVATGAQNEAQGIAAARQLGCGSVPDVAACLRRVPVEDFVKLSSLLPTSSLVPMIVADGIVLPTQPMEAITSGHFNHVPIIVGTARDDLELLAGGITAGLGHPLRSDEYTAQMAQWFGPFAAKVVEHYPVRDGEIAEGATARALTDGIMFCQDERLRVALDRFVPVYGYEFTQDGTDQAWRVPAISTLGNVHPHHGAELPYIFAQDGKGQALGDRDAGLSNLMISYVAAMARDGDPNAGGGTARPVWHAHSDAGGLLAIQQGSFMTESAIAAHQCAFWNSAGTYFPSQQPDATATRP